MPRHPRALQHRQIRVRIPVHALEIHQPRVVVVLAREQRALEMRRMRVGERVRVRVPAPEAEIEPADAGAVVVDDDDLPVAVGKTVFCK